MLSAGGPQVRAQLGVYPPQHDSNLLISAMSQIDVSDRSVLDLCTGSGVVALAAARLGAAPVTAVDISPDAVRCARTNARLAGVALDLRCGDHAVALAAGPYDVVVCNPPYVPTVPGVDPLPDHIGPAWAWDAGPDGRLLLDPICAAAPRLLNRGGTMLLVHSELANQRESLKRLRAGGLDAAIIAVQRIPFGPVLTARAARMENAGLIAVGRRVEKLVVIRADKP